MRSPDEERVLRSILQDEQEDRLVEFSDIVSVYPFRKLGMLARHFLERILPKLSSVRCRVLILGFLHYLEMKPLSKVNTALGRLFLEAGQYRQVIMFIPNLAELSEIM